MHAGALKTIKTGILYIINCNVFHGDELCVEL